MLEIDLVSRYREMGVMLRRYEPTAASSLAVSNASSSMEKYPTEQRETYFPAVILGEYDSPVDALLSLRVPRDEAMDLLAAAWADGCARCILARVDGGR
jgi:hypothetical protein